jgi:DNA-binding beta-propeller fold protein YncE
VPEIRFEPAKDWPRQGHGAEFAEVAGVSVSNDGEVFAFARAQAAVLRFGQDGRLLSRWGGGDRFKRPHAIRCSPVEDAVFCVDDYGHSVTKYTPDGEVLLHIASIAEPGFTGYILHDSTSVRRAGPPFCYPTDVWVRPGGDLYVTDGYGNARIHHFSPVGELIESWGEPGDGPGQYVLPHGLLIDDDRLYVADRENDRVQVLSMGGEFLGSWTDCYRPAQLCKDQATGLIFVAELGRVLKTDGASRALDTGAPAGRITVRTPQGRIVTSFSADGGPVGDPFFAPHAIALDRRGDLYIAETYVTFFRGEAPPRSPLRKLTRVGREQA